jgi:hypothetical protein
MQSNEIHKAMVQFFLETHFLTFFTQIFQGDRIKVIFKDPAAFNPDMLSEALVIKLTGRGSLTILAPAFNAVD